MLAAVLIGFALLVLFLIFRNLNKVSEDNFTPEQDLEFLLLDKFVHSDATMWALKCKTSEEIIEKGQVKLWETAQNLRSNLLSSMHDGHLVLTPDADPVIMDNMITINKIAYTMLLAQEGSLPLPEVDEEEDESYT